MSERLFVRQINENHWQWRHQAENGDWHDEVHAGTVELLAEHVDESVPISLLLPGEEVVVRRMSTGGTDKKLLAKVLPFELEEQLIDPVEELHFSFGKIEHGQVSLMYIERETIQAPLDELLLTGCEVYHVFPEYFFLNNTDCDGVLLLDGERVIGKFKESVGFVIESNVAAMVLESLQDRLGSDLAHVRLVAEDDEALQRLTSCIPESWLESETITLEQFTQDFWDSLDSTLLNSSLNLRSGAFARKLPLKRWWQSWKTPAYLAAASFVFAIGINVLGYFDEKAKSQQIKQRIENVYLQAVPDGRVGNEEGRLENILAKRGGANVGEPTNLMVLLSALSKSMAEKQDIKLSNFGYNGDQRELTVSIEVAGLGELGEFRDTLAGYGITSESPRTRSQGDIYQASMKLMEQ